jgi:hypothetical protein
MTTSQLVVKDWLEGDSPRLTTVPGLTWNLNQRNNQMCNSLASSRA